MLIFSADDVTQSGEAKGEIRESQPLVGQDVLQSDKNIHDQDAQAGIGRRFRTASNDHIRCQGR